MTPEEKILLTKDVFSRVLCGVKVKYGDGIYTLGYNLYLNEGDIAFESYPMKYFADSIERIKPYLRPMSSMTEEEKEDYSAFFNYDGVEYPSEYVDWLNAHHFDYRGLIPMGLALEAPEGMYKTE